METDNDILRFEVDTILAYILLIDDIFFCYLQKYDGLISSSLNHHNIESHLINTLASYRDSTSLSNALSQILNLKAMQLIIRYLHISERLS